MHVDDDPVGAGGQSAGDEVVARRAELRSVDRGDVGARDGGRGRAEEDRAAARRGIGVDVHRVDAAAARRAGVDRPARHQERRPDARAGGWRVEAHERTRSRRRARRREAPHLSRRGLQRHRLGDDAPVVGRARRERRQLVAARRAARLGRAQRHVGGDQRRRRRRAEIDVVEVRVGPGVEGQRPASAETLVAPSAGAAYTGSPGGSGTNGCVSTRRTGVVPLALELVAEPADDPWLGR